MAEVSDELIKLERSTEEERAKLAGPTGDDYDAQWRRWREASERVQAPVTVHAAASGVSRYELEQAVKKAVRHAEDGPAAEESAPGLRLLGPGSQTAALATPVRVVDGDLVPGLAALEPGQSVHPDGDASALDVGDERRESVVEQVLLLPTRTPCTRGKVS
ncbi:hypothetical protein ACH40D_21005 [Streptomyces olivaceoviridis]|uniref:Uncharacterized protein n=1 Tax=Streptomyces olivaceoviridis TaxID=1921 RepID=A0ABW7VHS7_STROI|nr:hypothetical protein [Streptomyces corchorusii]